MRKNRSRRTSAKNNRQNRPASPRKQKPTRRSGNKGGHRQPLQFEEDIVDFIFAKGGQATRNEIAEALNLSSRSKRRSLEHTLKDLCRGKILACEGDIFRNHRAGDLVEAVIHAHPRGFGFASPVKPAKTKTPVKESRENDIFIPAPFMGSAAHGDRVLIRQTTHGDRPEGRIIKVLERKTSRIIGTFRNGRVTPEDDRLLYKIMIPPEHTAGAADNEIVLAEITSFDSGMRRPEGRIIKVLGNSDDPAIQSDIVIQLHELPHEFSRATIEQVEMLDGAIIPQPGRADLRDVLHVTIDGETAKDFDDAVAVDETEQGFRLHVSIADVSHYVAPGSPLDQDAYQRGTSVYFPGRVVPMLPERLSNDLCSLVPDRDRFAFTAILDFDRQGNLLARKFTKALIRSHHRFTYNVVQKILSASPEASIRKQYEPFLEPLARMAALATALETKRTKRGSIGFEIPEPEIILDEKGAIAAISRSRRFQAHKIIEELMLAANEAVAKTFSEPQKKDYDFLFRIHETPDPLKVEEFLKFATTIGIKPSSEKVAPKMFAGIVDKVRNTPREYIISNLMLRTMKQARYSPENHGHFGLAASDYCHFTSPIRRYPDLMVHRALEQFLEQGPSSKTKRCYANPEEAGEHLSQRERKAVDAERELVSRLQVRYMAKHIDEEFDGIVSGVASFGLFVELLDSFISGGLPLTDLTDDYYEVDEKNHRLIGKLSGRKIQIGDLIRVKVSEVNIRRRRINFKLAL